MKSSRMNRDTDNNFLETPHSNRGGRLREKEKLSEDIKYSCEDTGPSISRSWRSETES